MTSAVHTVEQNDLLSPVPTSVPTANRRTRRAIAWMHKQKGQNAILDRGLSTILATVAIIGVLGSAYLFSGNNNAQAQQNQLNAISAQVTNLFGSQSVYTGLTETVIANSGALSPNWVSGAGTAGAGIISVYKSPITLTPVTNPNTTLANGAYTMTVTALPASACVQLATTNIGTNEIGVTLPGSSTVIKGAADPATATAACTGATNKLVFTLT